MRSVTPSGSPVRRGTAARSASTTSTMLAPGCRATDTVIPGSPSTFTICVWSAADKRLRYAGQSLQLRLDGVGGELVEHPSIHPRGRDHHLGHGDVGDVELQDRGLADAVGQAAGDALDVLDDLHLGDVEVRPPIKPHLHHTAAAA